MSCEPVITIWGKEISQDDSITIRVALECFGVYLEENNLGEGEMGQRLTNQYLQSVERLRNYIFGKMDG